MAEAAPMPLRLADWTGTMQRSLLRQMISVVSRPGILSFAGGLPAPELFPVEGYGRALQQVLAADPSALQYGPPYEPLKEHIVALMAQRGINCGREQVFLTTGAQQALDVLTRLLLNPGGEVMLEEIVYTGAQQAVFPRQPRVLPLPTDLRSGIDVDRVAAHLRSGARPAFIYVIPEAHNPLGVSMSRDKRERLVDLAARYGVPVVEDDPYGFLHYDDQPALPPLRALEERWVFYVGSFSKILAPALRLGWMIVPEELVSQITVVKEAGDLESSALTQRAVAAFLDAGAFPQHLHSLCDIYCRRRDAMLAALSAHFPREAVWTEPRGGMFIWVALPADIDTAALLEQAVSEEQVAFIPGHAFALPGEPDVQLRARRCLRLNFSNCDEARIYEGVARLGRVVERYR